MKKLLIAMLLSLVLMACGGGSSSDAGGTDSGDSNSLRWSATTLEITNTVSEYDTKMDFIILHVIGTTVKPELDKCILERLNTNGEKVSKYEFIPNELATDQTGTTLISKTPFTIDLNTSGGQNISLTVKKDSVTIDTILLNPAYIRDIKKDYITAYAIDFNLMCKDKDGFIYGDIFETTEYQYF